MATTTLGRPEMPRRYPERLPSRAAVSDAVTVLVHRPTLHRCVLHAVRLFPDQRHAHLRAIGEAPTRDLARGNSRLLLGGRRAGCLRRSAADERGGDQQSSSSHLRDRHAPIIIGAQSPERKTPRSSRNAPSSRVAHVGQSGSDPAGHVAQLLIPLRARSESWPRGRRRGSRTHPSDIAPAARRRRGRACRSLHRRRRGMRPD